MHRPSEQYRRTADPLFRFVVGTAILLGLAFAASYLYWGSGPVIGETPWYIPTMHAFTGLAAFIGAFLALGRHQVLSDPPSYWMRVGFGAFGILSVFFVLSWPGLAPSGQGIIARLPGTSAWMAMLELGTLGLSLLAAVLARWPGESDLAGRRWLLSVAGWFLAITLLASLAVAFEERLPALVGEGGRFTLLLLSLDWLFMLLLAGGAILSLRRYLLSGDSLLGYVALVQVALAFVVLTAIIGTKRYDVWYYLSRIIGAGGFLSMMFGLLSGYVGLFRSEREKTRELEERSAEREMLLIDAQRQAAETRRAHDLLHSIIASSGDLIAAQDLDFRYIAFNKAYQEEFKRVFGEDIEASNSMVEALAHLPEDQQNAVALWGRAVKGESFTLEQEFGDPGLQRKYYYLHFFPLRDQQGQIVGAGEVARDVTERKQAEQERERLLFLEQEARESAERALQLRNEFLHVAAHELKTPLTAMRGFSQLAIRKFKRKGELDLDFVVHALTRIDQQSKKLAALNEQLLNVSRLEAGKLDMALEEVDLSAVIEAAIASVRETHPDRAFRFRNGLSIQACLDPVRIEQVVVNLLDNAAKFSPKDAPVETEVLPSGQDEVEISVRDYGKGVLREEKERIFERFHQAHEERHYGGMGLGLYVSRQIVRMHGGTIVCEAPEGKGARFVVRLPLRCGSGTDN